MGVEAVVMLRRKHVTRQALTSFPEPQDGELIVKVAALRGGNIVDIETQDGIAALARMPSKFNKLIWIKRGDFLIVSMEASATGPSYEVVHILQKPQVKHLQKNGLWPVAFTAKEDEAANLDLPPAGSESNSDDDLEPNSNHEVTS
eukprot:GILK01007983.1.p1 GENE.GILK01007983.1~~GILK01007983.1.p1  ORF type:complete len:146 (-),score=30.42 GILK01007983.1:126-563(-)